MIGHAVAHPPAIHAAAGGHHATSPGGHHAPGAGSGHHAGPATIAPCPTGGRPGITCAPALRAIVARVVVIVVLVSGAPGGAGADTTPIAVTVPVAVVEAVAP